MHRYSLPRIVGLPAFVLTVLLAAAVQPVAAQCADLPGCELVWSDEFDGAAVDETKWSFMLGTGTAYGLPAGWGNNELQYYRAENATVADGMLTITAKEESFAGRNYTSARLRSLNKGDWTFGRMEMRARMPIGQGMWPAFWMLPTNTVYGGWAASGEIDIVEYVGHQPSWILGTIHYGGAWPNNVHSTSSYFLPSGTFHDDFHVFAIEWEPGEIRWYIDGNLYAFRNGWYSTAGPFPAPFDVDFHLLLNLAVGGNLPGPPDASTVFPQEYVIDYVRVYQVPNAVPVVAIVSPTTDDAIAPGEDLTIAVDATDDGVIQYVEFLQDNALLGKVTMPPYELTLPNVAAGCYTLTARAKDDWSALTTSAPVEITVGDGCVQAPYRMTPAAVPGTIEAEDYDIGGQGVAYNDADANNRGGAYRPAEGVDLENTSDFGLGYNVGWTSPDEWLEYTVDAYAGSYGVEVRVASEVTGGTFHIELDGVDRTGPITFSRTFGWQNWVDVLVEDVPFEAGLQTLRFVVESGAFNFNKITVPAPPSIEDVNGCNTSADDPCQRTGSCWIQGSAWTQTLTVDRSDVFDTQGWAGLCDRVHVALVQGDCEPPGGQTTVTAFLSETSFAEIPSIDGPLACTAEAPGTVGAVPNGHDVPGVPLTLDRNAGDLVLNWGSSCVATDGDYVVYEGVLGSFTSHSPATCSTTGFTTWTLTPASEDSYYLVVPSDSVAEGSHGTDSNGAERPAGASTCLPQSVAGCM